MNATKEEEYEELYESGVESFEVLIHKLNQKGVLYKKDWVAWLEKDLLNQKEIVLNIDTILNKLTFGVK